MLVLERGAGGAVLRSLDGAAEAGTAAAVMHEALSGPETRRSSLDEA